MAASVHTYRPPLVRESVIGSLTQREKRQLENTRKHVGEEEEEGHADPQAEDYFWSDDEENDV